MLIGQYAALCAAVRERGLPPEDLEHLAVASFLLGCDAVEQSNYAIWCNQEFEALLQKGKSVSDQAERAKIYEEAQVVFKREAPWLTIAHSKVIMPMNKRVIGFVMDPIGIHRFDGVDVTD